MTIYVDRSAGQRSAGNAAFHQASEVDTEWIATPRRGGAVHVLLLSMWSGSHGLDWAHANDDDISDLSNDGHSYEASAGASARSFPGDETPIFLLAPDADDADVFHFDDGEDVATAPFAPDGGDDGDGVPTADIEFGSVSANAAVSSIETSAEETPLLIPASGQDLAVINPRTGEVTTLTLLGADPGGQTTSHDFL